MDDIWITIWVIHKRFGDEFFDMKMHRLFTVFTKPYTTFAIR